MRERATLIGGLILKRLILLSQLSPGGHREANKLVGGSVVSAWTVYSAFVVRSPRRSTDVPLCMAHSVRSA